MKCEEAMMHIKEVIDAELVRFFAAKRLAAEHIDRSAAVLVDAIADLTLRGGKRIRPFLCFVGYSAVIPADAGIQSKSWIPDQVGDDNLLHAMVGLELFQSFALIHDDVMDQDETRRGGSAVHEQFRLTVFDSGNSRDSRNLARAIHYGENMAMLAGDLAFAWADEEIAISGQLSAVSKNVKNNELLRIYQKMKEEAMYGQALDVMREAGTCHVSKERVDELKTAWYTVVRPLQIGSSLAQFPESAAGGTSNVPAAFDCGGARFREFEALWEAWGVPVGKLFQLRDDFLDGEIDAEIFEKKKAALQKKADQALADALLTDDIRALLADIVQFVSTRKS